MLLRVREEILQCNLCHKTNRFYFLSDFIYGERLVVYNSGKNYAYINLIKDKTYNEFVDLVESVLKELNISLAFKMDCVYQTFEIACDRIEKTKVSFKPRNNCCIYCGSNEFNKVNSKIISFVNVDFPEVTHINWNKKSITEKKYLIKKEVIAFISDMQKKAIIRGKALRKTKKPFHLPSKTE